MTWPAKQGKAQIIVIMAESNEDQLLRNVRAAVDHRREVRRG